MGKHFLAGLAVAFAAACGTDTLTDATADTTTVDDGTAGSTLTGEPTPGGRCEPDKIKDRIVAASVAKAAGTVDESTLTPQERHVAELATVYDADDSGVLDDAEQAAIVSDFTAGCAQMAANPPPQGPRGRGHHHGDCRGNDDGGTPPADRPAPPADRPAPPTALERYDANADGVLDADEKATMRSEVRARIAAGDRPFGPPPPPADAADGQ